jgi:ABC-type transport system involved in cytochrome c biogenesis permease component
LKTVADVQLRQFQPSQTAILTVAKCLFSCSETLYSYITIHMRAYLLLIHILVIDIIILHIQLNSENCNPRNAHKTTVY